MNNKSSNFNQEYLGVFQPPLNDDNSTIYYISTPDRKNLVMLPLVPNFFNTAYTVAKDPKYQSIFMIIPVMDMLFISDAYLFYHEIKDILGKNVLFFTAFDPISPTTDAFKDCIHICGNKKFQLAEYMNGNDDFIIELSFITDFSAPYHTSADVCISTHEKTIYFCNYITKDKIDYLENQQIFDNVNEIHMPFMKNYYGGLTYIETRKCISAKYLSKLYAHSFSSTEEVLLCNSIGHVGR